MAKGKLEKLIAELSRLGRSELTPDGVASLRAALESKQSLAVAKAAHIAVDRGLVELVEVMPAAFERFMRTPQKSDKGCTAKTKLVRAFYEFGSEVEAVYLTAIRHVQMEPIGGPPFHADTAAELRVAAALGLVRIGYSRVMSELVDLLADPVADARIGACRALAYAGSDSSVLLLRLKARIGDEDPGVLGACFDGLLELAPDSSLPFVVEFLEHPSNEVAEIAALALGQSRHEAAFEPLRALAESVVAPQTTRRRAALTALGMLRQEDATEYLLSLLSDAAIPISCEAVAGLELMAHDAAIRQRVGAIVAARADDELGRIAASASLL